MNVSLLRLHRHSKSAACEVPAVGHCTCTVHHPVTAEERALVEAVLMVARRDGDDDLVGYLQARLDTPCRTSGLVCPCGCGRKPWEHNPQQHDRRTVA